jgi:hypothetical protein
MESVMNEKNVNISRNGGPSIPTVAEFAAIGKKRIEDFVLVQTELLDELQETNRHWFDRMQSEANLASEFASKFTRVHSIPDAIVVCQEWTARHFEMAVEDGKHALADAQKIMKTGSRLLSDGWWLSSRPDAGV